MLINRFLIFAIAGSFVVFGHIQTTIAVDITIDKLLGTWYNVATSLDDPDSSISCSKLIITKRECESFFTAVTTTVWDGHQKEFVGKGKLENYKLRIRYQSPIYRQIDYKFSVRNNGRELILYSDTGRQNYDLYSRTTSVSAETKEVFVDKIRSADLPITYVDQSGCS